ncbi:MAG: GDSL-type esterase/lipase family protein [Oscillospiraceae bacterium]|nr:GDSL-type esterase/lipase family protein [Oscillospiraceae bacterium]
MRKGTHLNIKNTVFVSIVIVVVVCGFSVLRFFAAETIDKDADGPPYSDAPAETNTAGIKTPGPATPVPTERPTPAPTPIIVETPAPSAKPEGPRVQEQPPADDEFFADAAFIGNSLMDGFRMFSGLETCDYYAATSMTVAGINSVYSVVLDNGMPGTIMQGVAQKPYGKVYILLGINEIGFEVSYFKSLYAAMLDEIRASQPEADIYVMSLTPVSALKSASSDMFNMSRVGLYNKALLELAEEKGCYYLDVCAALSDESGFLPSAATPDGVHFNLSHYALWLEYVRTHYIPD